MTPGEHLYEVFAAANSPRYVKDAPYAVLSQRTREAWEATAAHFAIDTPTLPATPKARYIGP